MTKHIKIVAAPTEPTHAPQWFRDQWVGVILPVTKGAPPVIYGLGALGGLPKNERYVVETEVALGELRKKSPEAARWWEARFSSDRFYGLQWLVFPKKVCELVP